MLISEVFPLRSMFHYLFVFLLSETTHLVVYGQLDKEDRKEDDPAGKEDHQNERGRWYEAHSNTLTTVPTSHVVFRADLQS